jgi:mannose-1-phosphate guanylyltransferase/phosphomannomutase
MSALHPDRQDHIFIEFFDENGIDIPKSKEKKIEGAYFQRRFAAIAQIHEIGTVTYPSRVLRLPIARTFEEHLNVEALRNSNSKVVIDYAYAVSGAVLAAPISQV